MRPSPALPHCRHNRGAWESASIMRHDSQTAGLCRSGLTLSLSSQLLMISSRDEVQGCWAAFVFVLFIG